MSEHRLPRRGSMAFDALCALHRIGGMATAADWLAAAGGTVTWYQFAQRASSVLVRHGLVVEGAAYEITNDGRILLGEPAATMPTPEPQVPEPYTAPPFRPLQRRISTIVHRAGAFDFRNSPSLMGGERVPYRTPT